MERKISQDFEFTKEGFKLSYQRYLSDGITGLMFISFFIVAFTKKWELPFVGDRWLTIFPNSVGTEVQIAFLIFLFLIAPSIGITLNALGWFLLGTPIIWLIWIWEKVPRMKVGFLIRYLVAGTERAFDVKNLLSFFDIDNSRRLYDVSTYYEHLMAFYFPEYFATQIGYILGVSKFLRTAALFFLLLTIYFGIFHCSFYLGCLSLSSLLFFLLFASLNEYYQAIKILFMVYSLLVTKLGNEVSYSRKEIAQVLIKTGINK